MLQPENQHDTANRTQEKQDTGATERQNGMYQDLTIIFNLRSYDCVNTLGDHSLTLYTMFPATGHLPSINVALKAYSTHLRTPIDKHQKTFGLHGTALKKEENDK